MNQTTFALLAVGAGVCIALQPPANSRLRESLGHPLSATAVSVLGTTLTVLVAVLILRPPVPTAADAGKAPWWAWMGGPIGALFVLAGATLIRHLGAALYVALLVGGQLLCSLTLDHFALLGLPQQSVTAGRVVGVLLVVAGVACIKLL